MPASTALVMGTVAITVGRGNPKFIAIACINTVVAANAGGAWSAFGDSTIHVVDHTGTIRAVRVAGADSRVGTPHPGPAQAVALLAGELRWLSGGGPVSGSVPIWVP